jgi:putative ABC transport system permease protein
MLQHLWKLTWKRKSRNLLLSLEILIAFAIVFGIAAFGLRSWQLYHLPLGFQVDDVWSVQLGTNGSKAGRDDYVATFQRALRELPEVKDVTIASIAPYSSSSFGNQSNGPDNVIVDNNLIEAGDNFAAMLGLDLVAGRWFGPGDDGAAVVINRSMALAMFHRKDALGGSIFAGQDPKPFKVIGVISDYRSRGEFDPPGNVMFQRFKHGGMIADISDTAGSLLVKLAPGTGRAFENRLRARLQAVRGDWTYETAPLASWRSGILKHALRPLFIMGIIGAFMLVMVAFGLFGALWQNTAQRIPEIGLRRALGARSVDIYGQIIAEQMLLSSVAIVVALVLLVQLPLTGVLGAALNWPVFFGAAGLSMAVIYLLSLVCALYPGWHASRLTPTEALHHE